MAQIKRQILEELQKEARNYIKSIKGNKITYDDIIVAENLMIFGYKRGFDEERKNRENTQSSKENMAIINADFSY